MALSKPGSRMRLRPTSPYIAPPEAQGALQGGEVGREELEDEEEVLSSGHDMAVGLMNTQRLWRPAQE